MAQDTVPPTTPQAVNSTVLGDGTRTRERHTNNVLGAPIYFDTLGNVIGGRGTQHENYVRPKHHFLNRLDNYYCPFFVEGVAYMSSNQFGFGSQATYLPKRVGGYLGALCGINPYISLGPALRLTDCGAPVDMHLYGGVVFTRHTGFEVGLRIAETLNRSNLCGLSFTMGGGYANHAPFVSIGCSLTLHLPYFILY